jgi:hypothetical protein
MLPQDAEVGQPVDRDHQIAPRPQFKFYIGAVDRLGDMIPRMGA